MGKAPLVTDDIEAGKVFIERLNDFAPVKAAWWLRYAEDGERYLYVAFDGLDVRKTDLAYAEVLRITQEMRDHDIDPFRVKVVGTESRAAAAILDIYRRFPGRRPRFDGRVLAGMAVAEIYIYPPPQMKP